MKILYIIYASRDGRGGHYHSLYETARKVMENEDVTVVSVGVSPSPILKSLKKNYLHLPASSLLSAVKVFLDTVKKIQPDVIHAFDTPSYFIGRIASFFTKTPILLTKCGGPNPARYFPYCKSMILYSAENKKYFKEKEKFRNSNIYLIPNRVSLTSNNQDSIRINKLKKYLSDGSISILRVARFTPAYRKSMLQAINLTLSLLEKGHNVKLFIIGVVQDEEVYHEIIKYKSDNIIFLVEDEFTINASEVINFADIVLGTGRSFMEAALLGKTMLVPCENLDLPVLVKEENIDYFFSKNFSPRITSNMTSQDSFKEIERVILKKSFKNNNILKFANENFSSELIYKKHIDIYRGLIPEKFKPIDLMLHAYTLRRLF